MSKQRYTASELDARLKFILGSILGLILFFTALGILYALIFVTQPVNAQSENDKMFFNVLGSIATFITGTLAGILIGSKGGDDPKNIFEEEADTPLSSTQEMAAEPVALSEQISSGKPEGEMPEEQPVDEDWDKD